MSKKNYKYILKNIYKFFFFKCLKILEFLIVEF